MKKKLLAAAILSTLLWACDSKDEPQQAAQKETVQPTAVKMTLSEAKVSAEKRYQRYLKNQGQFFNAVMKQSSPIANIAWDEKSLQSGDQGLHAQGFLRIEFNPDMVSDDWPEEFMNLAIPYQSQLEVSEALLQQNIEGKLKTTFQLNELFEKEFPNADENSKRFVKTIADAARSETHFLGAGKIHFIFNLDDFKFAADGAELHFKGFQYQSDHNEKDVASVLRATKDVLEFQGLNFKEADKTFQLSPFKFIGELDQNGNGYFSSQNPISFEFNGEGEFFALKADSIQANYKQLKWLDALGDYSGQVSMDIKDVSMKNSRFGQDDLPLGSASIRYDVKDKNERLDVRYNIDANFNAKTLTQMGLPVELNAVKWDIHSENISQQSIKQLEAFSQNMKVGEEAQAMNQVLKLFYQDQAVVSMKVEVDTALGSNVAQMKFLPPQKKIDHLFVENPSNDDALNVLKAFKFEAQLELSEALLNHLGVLPMVQIQTASFMKREDGMLKYNIEAQDGKLTINGKNASDLF